MSKRVLILNWKDIRHPQAGGAEIVIWNIAQRMVKDGYDVSFLTAQYSNSERDDETDGIKIIRVPGGRLIHSFRAFRYFQKHLIGTFDIVIEQVNTAPYFISFAAKNEKVIQFYHQLAREIWFLEMNKIIGSVGYFVLEPFALWLQAWIAKRKKSPIVTISNSSKQDLVRFGFDPKDIHIIREGIQNVPLKTLKNSLEKEQEFTILFHSSLREMKRPLEALKAFSMYLPKNPQAKLWFSGGGDQTVLREFAEQHGLLNNVFFWGRTSDEIKLDLMQRAHVLVSTSIKEGWGLVVTEANSQGTPAISYDVDGLRDSTLFGGGVVVDKTPEALSKGFEEIYEMVLNQPKLYYSLRSKALATSKMITFENCYKDFCEIIKFKI
jgi:glycosyltransferase involved in cell wall biosynthesis